MRDGGQETSTPCACGAKTPKTSSISLQRIESAAHHAAQLLNAKLGAGPRTLEDRRVQVFARGHGVSAWAANDSHLVVAFAGVVDRVPTAATVTFDLAFFTSARANDVMWIELDLASPYTQHLRAPLRGVGVLRDPQSGHLLRCEEFELATNLLADIDAGDVAKAIFCILACVGLTCGLLCAAACVAVIACIACLGACVGADIEGFLLCVGACGIAVGGPTA